MLLDLIVGELEHLQAISVSRLSSLSLSKVVDNLAVWIGLLDVLVVEVNDRIAIRKGFSPDSITEDNFLLAIGEVPLDLTIVAYDSVLWLGVLVVLVVVSLGELHLKVLIFLFITISMELFFLLLVLLILHLKLVFAVILLVV